MTHLTEQQLHGYANRTLELTALLAADAHFMECGECAEKLQTVLQASTGDNRAVSFLLGELTAPAEEFHLSFAQLTGFLAASLNDVEQEIVTSHLPFCANCRAEVEDLRAFQQLLGAPQPATATTATTTFTPNWREHWQSLRAWAAGKLFFPLTALTAAMVLATLGLVFYWRQRAEPLARVEAPGAESTALPTPAPPVAASPSAPPENPPPPLSPEEQAIQRALATGRVEVAAESKRLWQRGASLMNGTRATPAFTILAPQGTLVESTQPQLRWTLLPQVKTYVVTVTDEHFKEVAHSEPLTQASWTLPVKLTRGQLYQWQVTATTEAGTEITAPAPSAPEAQFKVLASEPLQALQRARARYAGSHLELGILSAREGLLDAAAQEFAREKIRLPLARRLQQSLAQQRR